MEWTKEKIDVLSQMWRTGFTARQIAQKIGNGVTRNAVIGKAHRLGLSQRPQPAQNVPRPMPVTLGLLKQCEWPFGDPREPDFHFCQKPVKPGRPYCEEHCQIAYRTVFYESQDGKAQKISVSGPMDADNIDELRHKARQEAKRKAQEKAQEVDAELEREAEKEHA